MTANITPLPETASIPALHTLAEMAGAGGWRLGLHHSHPQHLLIWIARGQGRVVIRGQAMRFSAHNLLYIPADHLFALIPDPQTFGNVLTLPKDTNISLPDHEHLLRIRDLQAQTDFAQLIDAIQRERNAKPAYFDDALFAYTMLAAVWLRRAILTAPVPAALRADTRLAARFCDLILLNARSNRPVNDYADMLGVTPTHLARSCKSSAGQSAATILTEHSLHSARLLLRDTDWSFRMICDHLGFASPSYFTRFVRKHTGHTPSELRILQ